MEKYCRAGQATLQAGYLRLTSHSQYVILTAFPLQQRLHERASIFRYTNIACLCSKFRSSQLVLRSLYLIRGKDFSVVIYVLLWTQQYRRMKKEQRVQERCKKDMRNGCVKFCWETYVEWYRGRMTRGNIKPVLWFNSIKTWEGINRLGLRSNREVSYTWKISGRLWMKNFLKMSLIQVRHWHANTSGLYRVFHNFRA